MRLNYVNSTIGDDSVPTDMKNGNNSKKQIVIIGLGVGGLYAAKSCMNADRTAEVTIIEKRDYDMFSACGLPFVIEGIIPNFDLVKFPVPGHLKRSSI